MHVPFPSSIAWNSHNLHIIEQEYTDGGRLAVSKYLNALLYSQILFGITFNITHIGFNCVV